MITKGTKIWNRFWGEGVVDGLKGDLGHCQFTNLSCYMPLKGLTRLEDAPREVVKAEKKQTKKVARRTSDPDWISTEEAAARLGKPRIEVTVMCKKGKLEARKEGNHWLVSVAGIERRLG